LTGGGRLWRISGPDEMAYNEPGKEPQVSIDEQPVSGISDHFELAPLSVSLYALTVRR